MLCYGLGHALGEQRGEQGGRDRKGGLGSPSHPGGVCSALAAWGTLWGSRGERERRETRQEREGEGGQAAGIPSSPLSWVLCSSAFTLGAQRGE